MSESLPSPQSNEESDRAANRAQEANVTEIFDALCTRFPRLAKYRSNFEYDGEKSIVTIVWPAKDSWSEYGLEEFLALADECQTLAVEPRIGVINTSQYFMQLVEISDFELDRIQRISDHLKQVLPNGTTIAFTYGHFLVACAAIL